MAKDWERLSGETGKAVPTHRLSRLWKVGRLGLSVSASTVARKVANTVLPGDGDKRSLAGELFREKQAQKVLDVLGELKGASMKVGQILSSDPDLLPPEFGDKLAALQRDAPPMPYRVVKAQIEAAFEEPLEDVFRTFTPEPIGSASIGQVHRATLRSGEDVAVKVQYPDITASLESDLKNLGSLLTIGRMVADKERLDAYLEECRRAVLEEADYRIEAAHLARAQEVIAQRPGVKVPKPFERWTRESVVTMEFVEGQKLDDALLALPDTEAGRARKAELAGRLVETFSWMFHVHGELHSDPHPGNFLLAPSGDIVLLDFGCVTPVDMACADGVLDVMDACWQSDDARAARIYAELGFGRQRGGAAQAPDAALLRAYHDMVLEPFLDDEVFDFGRWRVRQRMQRFMMKHPAFLSLTPPAGLLMPARVMGGIKGFLAKVDARLNVHRMAVDIARERGRLTAEPLLGATRS